MAQAFSTTSGVRSLDAADTSGSPPFGAVSSDTNQDCLGWSRAPKAPEPSNILPHIGLAAKPGLRLVESVLATDYSPAKIK